MSVNTPSSLTSSLFETDDWELLIGDIENHSVVPVVGPGLLIHGQDAAFTMEQHVATELLRRLNPDISRLTPDRSLVEICSCLPDRRKTSDTIRKILSTAAWPIPEPLSQLAAIDGFDLYVSATLDSLLFQALKQARVASTERVYGLLRQIEDVDQGPLIAPVVFQMFGKMDGVADCALVEEEILAFAQKLLNEDHRPAQIFQLLAQRNLLFLGCEFPGWLGRLIRRVLRASGELRDSGIFAQATLGKDPGYVLFLERQGAKLWPQDSGVQFVAELFRRWRAKHPPEEGAAVFISYAREDGDVAQDLTRLLEAAGVRTWLDRNALRSGELWNEEVKKAIRVSQVFIPIISRHSARTQPRFAHKEWDLASAMGSKRICPLRTDLTPVPEQFAAAHSRDIAEIAQLVGDVTQFLGK